MARVEYHPEFATQFEELKQADEDVFYDVAALVNALATYERTLIEGDNHPEDISHPIVISTLDMWALRRTPATWVTPDADGTPILRIPYVWMIDRQAGEDYVLMLFIGDKTVLGNDWYPGAVRRCENELIPQWAATHQGDEPRLKRRRT